MNYPKKKKSIKIEQKMLFFFLSLEFHSETMESVPLEMLP